MWGQYNKAQDAALSVVVNVKTKSSWNRPPAAKEVKQKREAGWLTRLQ